VILDFVDPDGDGAATLDLKRRYLYGEAVDQILAQEDITQLINSADRVLFPLTDNLGTVRDLARNDSSIATHFVYDSFGAITSGNTSLTRYLFTSREFDVDTNLQYNRARYYDATTGRWLSHDPLSFAAGDTNTYRYVGNTVTNATDPSGLKGIWRVTNENSTLSKEELKEAMARLRAIMEKLATSAETADTLAGAGARIALRRNLNIFWNTTRAEADTNGGYNQLRINPESLTFLPTGYDPETVNLDGVSDDKVAQVLIGHELGHAIFGLHDPTTKTPLGGNVTLVENPLRAALGIDDREDYNGHDIPLEAELHSRDIRKVKEARKRAPVVVTGVTTPSSLDDLDAP